MLKLYKEKGLVTGKLSTAFCVIALMIKLSSKWPVFFKQVRCQEDGNEFMMIKFRTMREDAEKESGHVWAHKGDERCMGIGKFMRKWNIDELPQLWNVLVGEMSLVGQDRRGRISYRSSNLIFRII